MTIQSYLVEVIAGLKQHGGSRGDIEETYHNIPGLMAKWLISFISVKHI